MTPEELQELNGGLSDPQTGAEFARFCAVHSRTDPGPRGLPSARSGEGTAA